MNRLIDHWKKANRSFSKVKRNVLRNFRPTLGVHRSSNFVPQEYRSNFRHLYMDIAWFGILNGTILSFLSVFATRSGASGSQVGFIGAVPAVANLIFSIPASILLQKLPTARVVFWSSFLQRIFYLGLALLPFFIRSQPLIWVIIISTFLMSIPGTGLAVGMNALIAQTVPVEWRAHVVGRRNTLLSLFSIGALTLSGQLLTVLPFPVNYQVVFIIGFLGSMLSCLHLYLIKPLAQNEPHSSIPNAASTRLKSKYARGRLEVRRKIKLANQPQKLNLNALKGKYGLVMFILSMFWLALFLSVPIFPVYMVNVLKLNDQTISLGSSFFQITAMLGATQIGVLARRHSNHKLTGLGLTGLMVYPLLLPLSKTTLIFIIVSALGGVFWAMVNGCLVNYLLELIPSNNLAGHLAWYNLALNAATLAGSLFGPMIAAEIGLTTALIVFGLGRFLSGIALLRWG
jgi:MFS family permease